MWEVKGVQYTGEEGCKVEEGWEPFAMTTFPPSCSGATGHGGGVILWLRKWVGTGLPLSGEDHIKLYEMDKDGVLQLRYLVTKAQ